MSRTCRCADCDQIKPHEGRGLCTACYFVRRRNNTLDERPTRPPVVHTPGTVRLPSNSAGDDLAAVIGISYRQLDYWVRRGYLKPENPHGGTGSARYWSADERRVAAKMARLVAAGLDRSGGTRCGPRR